MRSWRRFRRQYGGVSLRDGGVLSASGLWHGFEHKLEHLVGGQIMNPAVVAKIVPAWMGVWLIRLGAYLQAIGRECYYQCDHTKQCTIHNKLEKVYVERD